MLQVAAGGLESILDTVTELRALTVRVTNGSLSASETSLVQEEFAILRGQIDDIAAQTRFSDTSLLSGRGKVADAGNRGYFASDLDGNAFEDNKLLTSFSRGAFKASLPAQVDINVREDESNAGALIADVKIGDHTFSLNTHNLADGDAAVFKSDDGYTQFALETSAGGAALLDTRSELYQNLQDTFSGASIAVGATIEGVDNTNASTITFNDNNISSVNLDRTMGSIHGDVQAATGTGTGGDITLDWTVGTETFRGQGIVAAAGGTIELVSTSNSGRVLALNLGSAYAGTDGTDLANAVNNMLAAGDTLHIGDIETASGFQATANSFTATDGLSTEQTRGYIEGSVKSVSVTSSGSGHNASITLDSGQTFVARDFTANAGGGAMVFYDENDSTNSIALDYTNDTDLGNRANIHSALTTHLGLDNGSLGVQLQSENSFQGGENGFDTGVNMSIKSAGSSAPGKFAFSYDAESKHFSLKNGTDTYRVKARDADSQVVSFGNGVVVAVGTDTNRSFDYNKSIDQVMFSTEDANDSSFRFRVNTGVDDEISVNIGPVTSTDLGLDAINVSNMASAKEAGAKLSAALTFINVSLASVGAQQSRIDTIDYGLQRQYDATAEAEGIIMDVDIGDELSRVARLDVLSQTAAAMFSRAQTAPQRLTDLLLR